MIVAGDNSVAYTAALTVHPAGVSPDARQAVEDAKRAKREAKLVARRIRATAERVRAAGDADHFAELLRSAFVSRHAGS